MRGSLHVLFCFHLLFVQISPCLGEQIRELVPILQYGSSRCHSTGGQRPRHDRYHLLVRTIVSSNMEKLEDKEYGRPTGNDDVYVVFIWSTIWRIRDCTKVQHSIDSATAMFLLALRN